jgi:hypothetical protein
MARRQRLTTTAAACSNFYATAAALRARAALVCAGQLRRSTRRRAARPNPLQSTFAALGAVSENADVRALISKTTTFSAPFIGNDAKGAIMNADDFKKVALAAMTDETALPVHITISDAWMLVSALQLSVRHPGLHQPLKDRLTEIARQFQASIAELHPEANQALEMGWSEEYDETDIDDDDDFDGPFSMYQGNYD